jgi:hypothetical protein
VVLRLEGETIGIPDGDVVGGKTFAVFKRDRHGGSCNSSVRGHKFADGDDRAVRSGDADDLVDKRRLFLSHRNQRIRFLGGFRGGLHRGFLGRFRGFLGGLRSGRCFNSLAVSSPPTTSVSARAVMPQRLSAMTTTRMSAIKLLNFFAMISFPFHF